MLKVRFGDEGVNLMPEIEAIHEEDKLLAILEALETAATLDDASPAPHAASIVKIDEIHEQEKPCARPLTWTSAASSSATAATTPTRKSSVCFTEKMFARQASVVSAEEFTREIA